MSSIFSASNVVNALAESLTTIRLEDGLTYSDMAAVLGKSDDQAAKYCAGAAAMDVVTLARAWREWNGRFIGGLQRLVYDSRPGSTSDRDKLTDLLKAALKLSAALEGEDAIDPSDIRAIRGALETARDSIDGLLGKLQPRNVA